MSDMDDRLRAMAESPAPSPRAEFADALEARLRAVHATDLTAPTRPSRLRTVRMWLATAAVAAVAAIVTIVAGSSSDPASASVQLTSATGAVVELPDGTVVNGTAGLRLPNGAVVRTGAGGRVVADGIDLGADAEAVVVNGRLRRRPITRPLPTTTPLRPTTTVAPTPVTRPGPGATSPPPTRPAPPPPTTTTSPRQALRLSATADRSGAVMLRWSAYPGPAFDRYVLSRAIGDRTQTLAEIRDVDTTEWRDQLPDRVRSATYRIVALSADGRVLAASAPVSVSR